MCIEKQLLTNIEHCTSSVQLIKMNKFIMNKFYWVLNIMNFYMFRPLSSQKMATESGRNMRECFIFKKYRNTVCCDEIVY
jgi:hypothetical protein